MARGESASLVLRSSAAPGLWVQVSRVGDDEILLCEASSSEYLGWRRELSDAAIRALARLGWQEASGAFMQWAEAKTPEQRQSLGDLLLETWRGPPVVATGQPWWLVGCD